ncbi:immunoglobulin domain-containing protein, partial [Longispora fulva]|uniref:immunoglobulin domain-containing protein n=2 Tax=Bacteria TaxID=2 RepID=UPI00363D1D8F
LTIIGICVADINNPGLTVGDLRTNAADEDAVRWYYNRTDTTPIPKDTELMNNTDYYASIVSADGNCETNRRKTTVQFFSEPAPTGNPNQEFCAINNPTLSNIVASGQNRYFSTANSETELSPNTPLVSGRTYYLTAVGENCESIDRLAVTVTVTPAISLEEIYVPVCSSEIDNPTLSGFQTYYQNLLDSNSVPPGGSFSPPLEDLYNQYKNNPIGIFTTKYSNPSSCIE